MARRSCSCMAIRRRTRCGTASPTSSSADFRLVLADLRGYGDSARPVPAATPELEHAQYSKRAMAADMVALMRSLGHERFAVVGRDRGARVAHRLALDHPERVERLALLDIVPTLDMYERTDLRSASLFYHWCFLIQPAPLPERMIGGDPAYYLRWMLGGFGSRGIGFVEPGSARRVRALLLPRRGDPRDVRGLPRSGDDRPRARSRGARGRREDRVRAARAVGRARRRRPALRPPRRSGVRRCAGAVSGAALERGPLPRRGASDETVTQLRAFLRR